MIRYTRYKDGKTRVATFSFDDGCEQDARLTKLYKQYGVRGTFHLNSFRYENMTENELAAIREQYSGNEISSHSYHHPSFKKMNADEIKKEMMTDRVKLESIGGYPVYGMSYPYGDYNDNIISAVKECGFVYSRTVFAHGMFNLPEDFMLWHPTCHQADTLKYLDRFLNESTDGSLLYLWGHGYELETEKDWERMETVVSRLAADPTVWVATNMEIYRYVKALGELVLSADGSMVYNPTATDVWVETDSHKTVHVGAGEKIMLDK